MAAIVQAQANSILNETLGTSSPTLFTSTAKVKLTTTAPTATAAGTELSGTGYTTGGSAITFSAASAGATTGPTSNLTWTNSYERLRLQKPRNSDVQRHIFGRLLLHQ